MKKFSNSARLALLFISGIGFFNLLYKKNLTNAYLALGMALALFICKIFQKSTQK